MGQTLLNPHRLPGYEVGAPSPEPLAFHRRLPGYAPTPVHALPDLARRLGVAGVFVKDESDRLGLPAYKVLGATWATWRLLSQRLQLDRWRGVEDLRERIAREPRSFRLVTATDGNHGRGVARVARWLGLAAEIHVPEGTAEARIAGIRSEGATVVEVPGTYDAAVASARRAAGLEAVLVQDHGWPGYEQVPAWVAEGYETLLLEADEQLRRAGAASPGLVLVQIGVGTLASAVVRHYRRIGLSPRPALVGVEPTGAACALASIRAGRPVLIEAGAHSSIMAGLNCGTPSSAAWPSLRDGMDGFVTVEDEEARIAMRLLAARGIVAGESGAAGLAGLIALLEGPEAAPDREALGIGAGTEVLLLSTEGATDPAAWRAIVGRGP